MHSLKNLRGWKRVFIILLTSTVSWLLIRFPRGRSRSEFLSMAVILATKASNFSTSIGTATPKHFDKNFRSKTFSFISYVRWLVGVRCGGWWIFATMVFGSKIFTTMIGWWWNGNLGVFVGGVDTICGDGARTWDFAGFSVAELQERFISSIFLVSSAICFIKSSNKVLILANCCTRRSILGFAIVQELNSDTKMLCEWFLEHATR